MSELRHALRRLSRTPGFTTLAIVTLALGIGASTALFSLVERVLLRPLPFRDPGQLVWLRESTPTFGTGTLPINAYHFEVWRERAKSFAALSIVAPGSVTLTGRDRPEPLPIVDVSAEFFAMLGTSPTLGRTFLREEETEGLQRVLVISEALWRREFDADPAVIGRTIQLDHVPHTVIGVLPADFQFPRDASSHGAAAPALYRPNVFSREELREKFGRHNYSAIGRLQPGAPIAQGVAELNQIGSDIVREIGEPKLILRAEATPLQEAVVGPSRRALWMLFGAVTAVLLIGCVNLMNFLLAQAEQRKQDSAVRQALGATRGRLLRQSLTEALLVAAAGGALGVGLAQVGLVTLLHRLPANLPRLAEVRLDGGVLLFALATTLLTALLFGLLPAWRTSRTDPQQALASSTRTVAAGGRGLADVLVATEVTISLVLLATAALLGASFSRLLRTDKGFNAPRVLTAEVSIPLTKYAEGAQRLAFFERTLQELQSLPRVSSVAMINALPLQGETWIEKAAVVGDSRSMAEKPNVNARFINGGYFETLGVSLRGRSFTAADRNRPVTIVSETLARLLWPGEDPIGQRIERWPGDTAEVIGVAGDIRVAANREPLPMVYRPYWAWPPRRMMIAIRTVEDPRAAAAAFRAVLRKIDTDIPVPALRTMDDILAGSLEQERFQLTLAAVFAGAALLLTALGLFGVVAYSVTRRRRELGIRLALGATPRALQGLIFQQGMRPVWIGLLVGTAVALATGRVLGSLLFETRSSDPWMLGGTIAALAAVAAIACYLPGRKATEVDPITVLRAE